MHIPAPANTVVLIQAHRLFQKQYSILSKNTIRGWAIRVSNSNRVKRYLSLIKYHVRVVVPSCLLLKGKMGRFLCLNAWGLHLLPRLRMNIVVPLPPQYTFRAVTGTNLLTHFTWLTFFLQVIETDKDFWKCTVM